MPDDKPPALGPADADAASALAAIPKPGEAPATDTPPDKAKRRSRSGTSGAERARRARSANADKPAPTPRVTPLEKSLRDGFATAAELCAMVAPADAAVLKHNGPKLAHLFATKYPRTGAQLARLLNITSELDGLAVLGLVVGLIADNHGLLPAKASAGVKLGAMLTGIAPPANTVKALEEGAGQLGALMGLLTNAGTDDAPPAPEATPAAA